MKKLFLFVVAAMSMCASTYAQEEANIDITREKQTVMHSRFWDNWFIGAGISGQMNLTDLNSQIFKNRVYPVVGIRGGKWVTPILGAELYGEVLFHNSFQKNTALVDAICVGANVMTNINNIVHRYKGRPDFCEVMPFVGLGYTHGWGEWGTPNSMKSVCVNNGMAFKTGAIVAFNMGKSRAWQLSLRPSVIWEVCRSGDYYSAQFNINYARLSLEAGVTYKFKNHYGTHNFVLATMRDQNEVDELNRLIEQYREELAQKPKVVEKIVTKEVVVANADDGTNYMISFDQGSDKPKGDIAAIAAMLNKSDKGIEITGFTSPEGPERVNRALAKRRAEAAKAALVAAGVDANRIVINNNYEDQRKAVIKYAK